MSSRSGSTPSSSLNNPAPSAAEPPERGHSLWSDAWHRLRQNRLAVAGGGLVAVLALACALGPWLFHLSYNADGLNVTALPPLSRMVKVFRADPSAQAAEMGDPNQPIEYTSLTGLRENSVFQHAPGAGVLLQRLASGGEVRVGDLLYRPGIFVLGSDTNGRDLLARILYGGRISMMVGLVATFVALTIGVTYGAVAGYFGGKTDAAMMRIVDIIYSLPFTIFVILLIVMLKDPMDKFDDWLAHYQYFANTRGLGKVMVLFAAIGAVEWLTMARIVRGQIMTIKNMEYIEAARSLGLGRARIIFRHMLPNALGPIVVYATLTIPSVMLLESFLSFLGLGMSDPMASWGSLIKDGAEKMEEFWWLLVFPGLTFSLTLFSLNFLGDGLRDALDIRAAKD